ncbi:unnamed protein product [Trifolium pratense]|uniref:Uncharacterized protein n=1 Tax=Trifolium pratense TaxID=57577 RepID=A0ACB0J1H1_TRIPR|nr:unnamed protein product [Trifolium pratense]
MWSKNEYFETLELVEGGVVHLENGKLEGSRYGFSLSYEV